MMSCKFYQIKPSDIAFEIFKINILKRGLPFYKYLLPVVQVVDNC